MYASGRGGKIRFDRRMGALAAATAAVAVWMCDSRAATIRDDTPDSDYTSLGAESQYAASGYIWVNLNNGTGVAASGTLIAPGWVLTAAHVVTQNDTTSFPTYAPSQISFGQGATAPYPGANSVAAVDVESGWSYNLNQGNDLALIELSSPVTSVAPATLYKSSLGTELGQVATIVGYGDTGTGLTGYSNTSYGTRRGIQNDLDAFGGQTVVGGTGTHYSLGQYSSNLMFTDFDQPNNPSASIMGGTTPLPLEGCSCPGDSGGGVFLSAGGTTYLAGVTDFVGAFNSQPINGEYGNINGYTRIDVSDSMSFIDSVLAVACTWSAGGGGSWATPGDWTGNNIPQFAGATANFTSALNSSSTVTLDDTWTVGTINFNNSHSYTIAIGGGGVLVLDGGSTNSAVNDSGGTHIISAAVTLNTNTTITVTNSTDSVQISGSIGGAGALTMAGSGNLVLDAANNYSGTTTVTGGTLVAAASQALPTGNTVTIGVAGKIKFASNTGAETLSSLTVNTGGILDLTNNSLLIDYSGSDPISTIAGYIKSGYNGGHWNGPGIMSTAAQTKTNGLSYGLGYADGKDGRVAGLSSGQIEVMYTLLGDAKLAGTVNGPDLAILAANFNQSFTGWDQGDFNYDGFVNGPDLADLAANFNQGDSGAASAGDVAALEAFAAANGVSLPISNVPEPASASIVVAASIGFLAARRARRRPTE
ncbi:MAG: trypsin-like serine protease [Tepidisphaeraceae bacterium]|jgi:autotransporter-associated beta strand protein